MSDNTEYAVRLAQIEAKIEGIALSLDEVKSGLIGLGNLREELAKFTIHHEQFRNEAKTMWTRIDEQKDEIKVLKSTMDNWKGRLQMAGGFIVVMGGIFGSMATWSWIQVSSVPVLSEKVKQLEKQTESKK